MLDGIADGSCPATRGAERGGIVLRALSEARARAVLSGSPLPGDRWAEGYPAEGDIEAAETSVRQLNNGHDVGPFGAYEVIRAADGAVVGGIGFHSSPDATGAVEVGYGIVGSARNRGFGTAALASILELAGRHGVRRVKARALPANAPSRRVLEKGGLTFTGLYGGHACYEIVLDDGDEPPRGRGVRWGR